MSASQTKIGTMVASIGWAFMAGVFGWVLQAGDSSSGSGHDQSYLLIVVLYYAMVGLVFGLINPKGWQWASLSVWAIAFTWISITVVLRGTAPYKWTLNLLSTIVLFPLAGALVGGFAGMQLRTYRAFVISRKQELTDD